MASDATKEATTTILPNFPLLIKTNSYTHTYTQSPERPGMLTPPSHSLATIPFHWEYEPGKPKPSSTTLSCNFTQKCLELPPRLLLTVDSKSTAKSLSPTTVLDDSYMGGGSKSKFQSSSFRMGGDCYGSFKGFSPEHDYGDQQLGALILSSGGLREKGFLGSWSRRGLKGKREVGGGSYVFPSYLDRESECSRGGEEEENGGGTSNSNSNSKTNVNITKVKRTYSFSTPSTIKSHFWATIYDGLKQIVSWKSKKLKGDGLLS